MTTLYQDSTVDYFDLESFFFGCVSGLENSQAARPAGCTVIAKCISSQEKTIAKESFTSKVTSGRTLPAVIQDMAPAKPTGFKGCQNVNFNTVYADALGSSTVMDTIKYTVYGKKPLI